MKTNRMQLGVALILLISTVFATIQLSGSAFALTQARGSSRPITVLFLGTDMVYWGRDKEQTRDPGSFRGNSDSMMLVSLDPRANTVKALQIPRDTLVRFSGPQAQKINGANRLGGPALALHAVRSISGVSPDYYAVMNLQGFMNIVDALGGVTVRVPKQLTYFDQVGRLSVDLQPGVTTLNGRQAMGFVRFRRDGQGDLGRLGRQRLFVRAVASKIRNPALWQHLPAIVATAYRNVQTNIPASTLLQMVAFARSVPPSRTSLDMLPVRMTRTGEFQVVKSSIAGPKAQMM